MVASNTRFDELLKAVQDGGHRVTPQRLALLKLLAESDEHPSAAYLYERMQERFPTTGLSTVYKTLHLLKDMGEVLELGFSDDDNRYDARDPDPHPHLVCVCCHEIVDLDLDIANGLKQEVGERSGYRVQGYRVEFYGICSACQAKCRERGC